MKKFLTYWRENKITTLLFLLLGCLLITITVNLAVGINTGKYLPPMSVLLISVAGTLTVLVVSVYVISMASSYRKATEIEFEDLREFTGTLFFLKNKESVEKDYQSIFLTLESPGRPIFVVKVHTGITDRMPDDTAFIRPKIVGGNLVLDFFKLSQEF
jgi:hypothetical protein